MNCEHDEVLAKLLDKAGIEPQLKYAIKKTGLLVGPPGETPHTEEQREEWLAAIDEYYKLQEEEE